MQYFTSFGSFGFHHLTSKTKFLLTHISSFLVLKQCYTGQTLGILLFSSHLCISFTGFHITVSCYEFDELLNFQVPYWRRIGMVSFFSAITSHNLKPSEVAFPQSKNKYIYMYLLFKLSKYVHDFCIIVLWCHY